MNSISIQGVWRFELDREDVGAGERWFARELGGSVRLPGSLAAQGSGDEVTAATAWTGTIFGPKPFDTDATGRVRMKCWLQPERVYTGAAWYQRDVEIPALWAGGRVTLELERPHWFTRVWLDEREVGTGDSLSTPHVFDLGRVEPGQHRLTLRIDNRLHIEVGENAHSVSDHTQGNWNGVVGRIELRATPRVWIEELQVIPDVAARSVAVRGAIGGDAVLFEGRLISLEVTIDPGWGALSLTRPERLGAPSFAGSSGGHSKPAHLNAEAAISGGRFEATLALGADASLWDEFSPVTHTLEASIPGGDSRSASFGLRDIRVKGRQLLINGRPLFLRGTVDCCVFPVTGHPPTDVGSWRTVLGAIVAHGLNHVRFHSWCPPEAAFVAGDELGIYFQVEAPTWPNSAAVLAGKSPVGIGDGAPVDAWTLAESERIVRTFGNHPCFVMMAAGNEPGGPNHREYLAKWVTRMRALDPRRLYTGAAGWPELAENDFSVLPEPRIHQWGDNLNCRLNATPPATTADYRASVQGRSTPVVSHEIGQWSSYPPVHDVAKYTGHLKPRNFEVFAESLAAHGMAERARAFVEASGRLQMICYKEEIESQLRTPGLGGFQLLALQDFPGQGTAPVGVLDHFFESKGYASVESFRRFCGPTVPLARLARRVFKVGETMEIGIEVAHFGSRALEAATASWRLEDVHGVAVRSGRLDPLAVSLGAGQPLGSVAVLLDSVPPPARYRLVVGIEEADVENDWDVWVYPDEVPAEPENVLVTNSVEAALRALADERRVLLTAKPEIARGEATLGFTPIFWNTWCTDGQQPHTLGIVCDPDHPAFADFPTEHHSNWQWWHVVTRAGAFALDGLPAQLRPIVHVIDDWYSNRKMALVFEARVGEGSLLVCGTELTCDLGENPVARQLRASFVRYVASERFAPTVELCREQIAALVIEG
ncbi:MAG TPA: glycoside hydrolase family 2 TIM barrel-domain containing protein [Opitutaceae bacterium]|nr:glycoside hydrolase family 2 TIM barrel-domain containing protein [Opitutaceae bacterium]